MRTATSIRHRQVLNRVGENLFRDEASGIYYLIYKQAGKQIRRSLKTTDAALARRKRDADLRKLKQLAPDTKDLIFAAYDDDGKLVGGLAKDWFEFAQIEWTASVIIRETYSIKELSRHFGHQRVRSITAKMVETWAKARRKEVGPDSFNRERMRLIQIFDYAIEHKELLENTAEHIPKLKVTKHVPKCPTDTEFAAILADMRSNDGKRDGRDSANLCEGLTSIGCRKGDAEYLEWRHIDFTGSKFTITGHPQTATKNHEERVIPLFAPFARLLRDMLKELPEPPKPTDKVFKVKSCRKAFESACRRLGLPHYPPHHTWRRLFITNCLRAGVNLTHLARWVGHRDGGKLILNTYAVYMPEYSQEEAAKVTFDASKIGAKPDPMPDNVIPMPSPSVVGNKAEATASTWARM